MHATEEIIDPKIGHKDGEEGKNHEKMIAGWSGQQPNCQRGVEGNGIDEHGDERPHLFGIPTPVGAPRHIGPHGSDEDAAGKHEYSGIEKQLAERGEQG